MSKKEWFSDWFDTKYYHILYQHRNDTEAQFFMQNLTQHLQLEKGKKVLDLACGKGRHSVFLNSLGYDVLGVDLSKNSIEHAKQFENETLQFNVHDMREPFTQKFDTIFNLFTSFGYFEDDNEDINVLQNIKNGLTKDGIAVIDFLNYEVVTKNLVSEEKKTLDNITFHITRKVIDNFIVKTINFNADGQEFSFQERVKCLSLEKIKGYLKTVGLELKETFGSYDLQPFDQATSNRLIIVVQ